MVTTGKQHRWRDFYSILVEELTSDNFGCAGPPNILFEAKGAAVPFAPSTYMGPGPVHSISCRRVNGTEWFRNIYIHEISPDSKFFFFFKKLVLCEIVERYVTRRERFNLVFFLK